MTTEVIDGLDQPFTPPALGLKRPKVFVQLGRYGDIFNVLPLALAEYKKTGVVPFFMVAEEFAYALCGVSYVTPVLFDGPFEDVHKALFQAAKLPADVVFCQIYGKELRTREITSSFLKESWLQAGATAPWGSLPLVFDRRDAVREYELFNQLVPESERGKRLILTALGGKSSPFPYANRLLRRLKHRYDGSKYFVLDLTHVRAVRMHDLLGLMDLAWVLIAVDSGVLHLAHASEVPVISLITSRPTRWHGSAWRPNHVGRFLYDEFPDKIDEVLALAASRKTPRIIHTWADFKGPDVDPETQRRQLLARSTWNAEYTNGYWGLAELPQGEATRSGYGVGDDKPVPFLRDVILRAHSRATHRDDIIAITNADVCLFPGITGAILEAVRRFGSAYTHRWDFERLNAPLNNEAEVKAGLWYPGSDAFFISVEWWEEFKDDLPDLLMGREKNDEVFRQLIKRTGGIEIPACIYHEKHASYWERPENFETNGGNQYNRGLARKWVDKTGYMTNDWKWWPAIEGDWGYSCPGRQRGLH